jgi:hypothetical protein
MRPRMHFYPGEKTQLAVDFDQVFEDIFGVRVNAEPDKSADNKKGKHMTNMRAKVRITTITQHDQQEELLMHPVAASSYPEDGSDENNTYAHYSPSGEFRLTIANPALRGQFEAGDEYYVDFRKAE